MSLRRSLIFGAIFGVSLFAAETALVLRTEAAGLAIDIKGPFAALIDVAKASLPWLLGKVLLLYICVGAVGAALAHFAATIAGLRRVGFLCVFAALALLPLWARVQLTPALVDDLAPHEALAWLVDRAEPWYPQVAAAAALSSWLVRVFVHDRRRGALVALALGLVVSAIFATRLLTSRPEDAQPVVILFGIDALRPDRLAAEGEARAVVPNLDAFVADATRFTAAYTPIAQTEPAWRSLLTGLYPSEHGVRYALIRAAERKPAETFAQRFAAAGWQTVFRTDCSRFNFQGPESGFAVRVEPPRGALNFLLEKIRYRGVAVYGGAAGAWLLPELTQNRALAGFYDARAYAERVADDVVTRAAKGPLLYAYHATAAHFPGDAEYPFYRRFASKELPLARRLRMTFRPLARGAKPLADDAGEALYDELLAQADMQLGVLLERLKRSGIYDRATIVVFSDHGEDFYEDRPALRGAMSVHGAMLNARENRIVLAVKPGTRKRGPMIVDEMVRLIDVGPTLLALAGLPSALGHGRSLVPMLEGASIPQERLYLETAFTHVVPDAVDADHYAGARRDFEAYRLHADGLVEIEDATHDQIMLEKDYGAFDGKNWWITWRRKNGTAASKCVGECEASGLRRWFEAREGTR